MAEKDIRNGADPGNAAASGSAGDDTDEKAGVAAAREAEALKMAARRGAGAKAPPAAKSPPREGGGKQAAKSRTKPAARAGGEAKHEKAPPPPVAVPQRAKPAQPTLAGSAFLAELRRKQLDRIDQLAEGRLSAVRRAGDLAMRILDYLEADTAATYDTLSALAGARTVDEAVKAQRQYASYRLNAWRDEAVEIGEASLVAAREAAAPIAKELSRFVTLAGTPLAR